MATETAAEPTQGGGKVAWRLLGSFAGGLFASVVIAVVLIWTSTRIHPPWEEQPDRSMLARTPGVLRTLVGMAADPDEPQAIVSTTAGLPLPALVKRSSYPLHEPPLHGIPIRPSYMAAEELLQQWWRYRPTWGLAGNATIFGALIFGIAHGLQSVRKPGPQGRGGVPPPTDRKVT